MKEAGTRRASEAKDTRVSKKKQQLSVKEQKAHKRQARKERKAKKDPNKPKRPPTPFLLFLEDFRKAFKEEHPNAKGVAAMGKASGDRWKEMTDEDKAPYVQKAAQRRAEYEKALASYNQKQGGGGMAGGDNDKEDDEDNEDEGSGDGEDDDEEEE